MANYSYGGLSVAVVADTRGLTRQVATASRQAGNEASKSISGQLTKGFASVGKSGVKALGAIGGVAAGGMTAFLGSAVKAGMAYNVLYSQSLKAFKTVLGSQKAAEQMMGQIEKFGKTSPFPRQAFIKATQQMLAFGFSAKDVIPTLTAVQDAVAATGGSADDIQGIVSILSKVKSSGKITAETLNMLGDRGVNAAELIGKGMGKSAGDIRSQITAGTLDANKALTILTQQMEIKYKGAAQGLKSTWTGSKDSIKGAMRDIGSLIVEPFVSKRGGGLAIEWANKLSKTLWAVKPAVEPIVSAFMVSLKPALDAVNGGVNWLLDKVTALAAPKNIPAATAAVQKFGAVGLAAFGGLGAIAGAGILTQLPLVGPIVSAMVGPFQELAKVLGPLAKVGLGKLFGPLGAGLKGLIGLAPEASAAASGIALPILAIVAAFAVVMAASPKFRAAIMDLLRGIVQFFKPVIGAIIQGVKGLIPPIMDIVKAIFGFARVLGDDLAPIVRRLIPLLAPLGKILGAVLLVGFKILGFYLRFIAAYLKLVFIWFGFLITVALKVADVILGILLPPIIAIVSWIANSLIPAVKSVGQWFGSVFGSIAAVVSTAFAAVVGVIGVAVAAIAAVIIPVWNAILVATQFVWGIISTVIRIAWAVIQTAIAIGVILVRAYILAAWTIISAVTQLVWGFIGPYVMAVWNAILTVARVVWGAISGAITGVWNFIRWAVGSALAWINAVVTGAWNWLLSFTRAIWTALWGAISVPLNWIKSTVGAALAWIGAVLVSTFNFYLGVARAIWGAISGAISSVWNTIKTAVQNALNWIGSVISQTFNFYLSLARSIWNAIYGAISGPLNAIKSAVGAALGWIKSVMASAWNSAFATVRDIWGKIAGWIGGVWGQIKAKAQSAAGDVIRGMYQGFMDALKNVGKWVNDHIVQPIIKAVKDHFKIGSPSKVMAGLGGDLIAGLFKGLNPGNWGKMIKTIFGGFPEALGGLINKGVVAVEKLPKEALSALGGIAGKIGGLLGGLFGGGKGGPTVNVKTGSYSGIMKAVLASFGIPDLYGTFMQQMMTESGGNPNAINLWDSNAKAGHPSQGLMQVIPSTFAAYAGPYKNRGILDPLANIYAAVNYAISRYGKNIRNVLGHGHGYAAGGVIREPITGIGHWSGSAYTFGERGPERVSPLLSGGLTAEESRFIGAMGATRSGAVINVFPRASQSETEIAASVSRNLAWAAAGGGTS